MSSWVRNGIVLITACAIGSAAFAADEAEPMAGLFGNTMIGTSSRGIDRYVFRPDNSYLALLSDGRRFAGYWRSDAEQFCFFQVDPPDRETVSCYPQSGQERLGGEWVVDGDRLTVIAGVPVEYAASDFARLGARNAPMKHLFGRTIVRSGSGVPGKFNFFADHSYRFTPQSGPIGSGAWRVGPSGLCLFQIRPRGLGRAPTPCIARKNDLDGRHRWKTGGADYSIELAKP